MLKMASKNTEQIKWKRGQSNARWSRTRYQNNPSDHIVSLILDESTKKPSIDTILSPSTVNGLVECMSPIIPHPPDQKESTSNSSSDTTLEPPPGIPFPLAKKSVIGSPKKNVTYQEYNIFDNRCSFSLYEIMAERVFSEIRDTLINVKHVGLEMLPDKFVNDITSFCQSDATKYVHANSDNIKFSITFREFVLHIIVAEELYYTYKSKVLLRILKTNETKIKMSSLLYQRIKLNADFSHTTVDTCYTCFVKKSNVTKWVSVAKMVKYLASKNVLEIDFPEFYSSRCIALNLHSFQEDSESYYSTIWCIKEPDASMMNYNRFFASLCFLKYLLLFNVE